MAEQPVSLLTEDEHSFVDLMGQAWNLLNRIVGDGDPKDADLHEAVVHVHALQNMVLAQAAARFYPGQYRALGWSLGSTGGRTEPYLHAEDPARREPDDPPPPAEEEPHEYVPERPGSAFTLDLSCVTCGGLLTEPGTNHTNLSVLDDPDSALGAFLRGLD
jgi:hypothetical protein